MLHLTVVNLILHHFVQAKIGSVVLFNCWDAEAASTLSKMMSQKLLFTQFVHIDRAAAESDYFRDSFFVHTHPTLGVFLDLNCQRSALITNMSSTERFYSQRYHWLIYDDVANITHFQELFTNANLSVDADVTYVMPGKSNALLSDSLQSTEILGDSLKISTHIFPGSSSSFAEFLSGSSSTEVLSDSYAAAVTASHLPSSEMLPDSLVSSEPTSISPSSSPPPIRPSSASSSSSIWPSSLTFSSSSLSSATATAFLLLSPPASASPSSTSFILYDVYNNGQGLGGALNMTIDRLISCTDSSCQLQRFLSDLHMRSQYGNRVDLHDISLRLATIVSELPLTTPPSQLQKHLHSINNTEQDGIARHGFQVVLILRDMLNCNFAYLYTDRWSTGAVFGGAIGGLVEESVDFVSSPFLITEPRLTYLRALHETSGFRSTCLFRTPRNSGIQTGVFLEPFSGSVWLIFAIMLGATAVILWSTFRIERRLRHCLECVPSLLTTALVAFGAACSQSTHLVPLSTGGRLVFLSLSLVTFLMYNYYTSLVVSSLLGSPVKSTITTMDQLADSSLEVGLQPLLFTMSFLNSSRRVEVQRFVQNKITTHRNPPSVWMPAAEGVKRVRDEPGFVYVSEDGQGYALIERTYKPEEICDLNEIVLRPEKGLHVHLHRNSSYTEIIKLKYIRMAETGIILKHRRYWVHEKLLCSGDNFVITVGLEYTAPLFFLLVCAYLVVVFVLIVEVACERYKDRLITLIKVKTSNDQGNHV